MRCIVYDVIMIHFYWRTLQLNYFATFDTPFNRLERLYAVMCPVSCYIMYRRNAPVNGSVALEVGCTAMTEYDTHNGTYMTLMYSRTMHERLRLKIDTSEVILLHLFFSCLYFYFIYLFKSVFIYLFIFMKSSDANGSKRRLKCSSIMNIHKYICLCSVISLSKTINRNYSLP